MGNNTRTYDVEAEYASKSLTQLYALRTQFELAVVDYPQMKFNEHLEFIKLKIAERIGRKNGVH